MRVKIAATVSLFLLSLAAYSRLVEAKIDHQLHIKMAFDWWQKGTPVPHPLFHALLLAASGLRMGSASVACVALLAIAIAWRTWLTAGALQVARPLGATSTVLLCLLLALAMPLPTWSRSPTWDSFPTVLLGQIWPNVWSSPTTIIATPFVLASYLLGLQTLKDRGVRSAAGAGAVMSLSLLAKPNYAMAFAPCLCLFILTDYIQARREGVAKQSRIVSRFLLAFGPPTVVLGWQAYRMWFSGGALGSRIIYAPLAVWEHYSKHVLLSLGLSVAFPAITAILFPSASNQDRALALAWLTFAVAMAMFCCLAESGTRLPDGTFVWGPSLALHVLFVASCGFILRQPAAFFRKAIALGCLTLHGLSGALYLARSLANPNDMLNF